MSKPSYAGVKGMNDLLPPQISIWQRLEKTYREVLENYGYQEVRTPVLEETGLFTRSVGETSDIVGKEMYSFKDRGDRDVSLRPEGTAPAARAYLEHNINQREPVTRWFYAGPMFRYERMKTGRYRSFHQLGVEVYGAAEPTQDVEVMELAVHLLERLGLPSVSLQINSLGDQSSRPKYLEAVRAHFSGHKDKLSPDAQLTLERNPMRLLDSKDPELKPVIDAAPVMVDFLDDASKGHFEEVKRQLTLLGVKYELNPRLVRGLDYYTRTAFELISSSEVLGTASAVGGGGRYDRLLEELGGPATPAVGWAMGLERLCLLMGEGSVNADRPALFVATVDAASRDEGLRLVTKLRHAGLRVDFDARGGSLKSQMKRSDKSGAKFTVVLGDRELKERKVQLKPMDKGQQPVEVSLDSLETELRARG